MHYAQFFKALQNNRRRRRIDGWHWHRHNFFTLVNNTELVKIFFRIPVEQGAGPVWHNSKRKLLEKFFDDQELTTNSRQNDYCRNTKRSTHEENTKSCTSKTATLLETVRAACNTTCAIKDNTLKKLQRAVGKQQTSLVGSKYPDKARTSHQSLITNPFEWGNTRHASSINRLTVYKSYLNSTAYVTEIWSQKMQYGLVY